MFEGLMIGMDTFKKAFNFTERFITFLIKILSLVALITLVAHKDTVFDDTTQEAQVYAVVRPVQ